MTTDENQNLPTDIFHAYDTAIAARAAWMAVGDNDDEYERLGEVSKEAENAFMLYPAQSAAELQLKADLISLCYDDDLDSAPQKWMQAVFDDIERLSLKRVIWNDRKFGSTYKEGQEAGYAFLNAFMDSVSCESEEYNNGFISSLHSIRDLVQEKDDDKPIRERLNRIYELQKLAVRDAGEDGLEAVAEGIAASADTLHRAIEALPEPANGNGGNGGEQAA